MYIFNLRLIDWVLILKDTILETSQVCLVVDPGCDVDTNLGGDYEQLRRAN